MPGRGNDFTYGETGNDTMCTAWQRDSLKGELNNEVLRRGDNNDRVIGGSGNDTPFGDARDGSIRGTGSVVFGESDTERDAADRAPTPRRMATAATSAAGTNGNCEWSNRGHETAPAP